MRWFGWFRRKPKVPTIPDITQYVKSAPIVLPDALSDERVKKLFDAWDDAYKGVPEGNMEELFGYRCKEVDDDELGAIARGAATIGERYQSISLKFDRTPRLLRPFVRLGIIRRRLAVFTTARDHSQNTRSAGGRG